MPRRLRVHQDGGFYHVTLRGNHQRAIFFADSDRHLLNAIVARTIEKFDARLHAYCWMTNHLHLLMQVGVKPLANPMRDIAAGYARAMQLKLQTTGHFFERRYHATLVDADAYLLELIRYIHMNPVRAGLVTDARVYPWSSHHAYLGARNEPWVTTGFALGMFSDDRARAVPAYRNFVGSSADTAWIGSMSSNGGVESVLGNAEFIARLRNKASAPIVRQTLTELLSEACRRFQVEPGQLQSEVRDPHVTKVRAWIARQASERHVATLAAVARALGRNEATLRYAMRAYPNECE
jgi:putative transposase